MSVPVGCPAYQSTCQTHTNEREQFPHMPARVFINPSSQQPRWQVHKVAINYRSAD